MTHTNESISNNNFDFRHFAELGYRINCKTATHAEANEFVRILYENDGLTQDQYQEYTSGRDVQGIITIALARGATLTLLSAFAELFGNE